MRRPAGDNGIISVNTQSTNNDLSGCVVGGMLYLLCVHYHWPRVLLSASYGRPSELRQRTVT